MFIYNKFYWNNSDKTIITSSVCRNVEREREMEGGHVIKNPCRIYITREPITTRWRDRYGYVWCGYPWLMALQNVINCAGPLEGCMITKSASRCVRLMRPSEMDSVREIRVFDCQVQLVTDRVVTNWPFRRDRNFNRCPRK